MVIKNGNTAAEITILKQKVTNMVCQVKTQSPKTSVPPPVFCAQVR